MTEPVGEPYYKDNMVTVYLGDCVEVMSQLAGGLYDLVVTSPPYNVGKPYEEGMDYGSYLKMLYDFYAQSFRIIKKGGYAIVNFGPYYSFGTGHSNYQPTEIMHHIIAERAGWNHMTTRIWQKDYATLDDKFTITTTLPKGEWEHIFVARKPGGGREKIREQHLHTRGIWSTAGKRQAVSALKRHPAAFPEVLVKMILEVYSDGAEFATIDDKLLEELDKTHDWCRCA